MTQIRNLLAALILVIASPAWAAGISAEKQSLIDELLSQTGQSAAAVGKQMADLFVNQMTMILQQSNPDIDPKAFVIVKEEIHALIDEEFISDEKLSQAFYGIYDKHFSAADLKAMIDFNNTELGKKIISVMPQITEESMIIGQQWGMALGPKIEERIIARFKEEGIE